MKQFICMLLLSFVVFQLDAQTGKKERMGVATTLGVGFSLNTPSCTPVTWQVTGFYKWTDRWEVGVGSGILFYEEILVPLYGSVRFQIGKQRRFIPYADLAVGGSFAPVHHANGGLYVNPSVGIRYSMKNKIRLLLAIGYESQKWSRLKKQTDDFFLKEFSERLYHHTISVKAGFEF